MTITKEGFIRATNLAPERAEKIYEELNDKFSGDWDKASNYLQDLVAYLNKHKN